MDDPLDQAFSVIEEVTQKIVDRFGEEGKQFVDPNRLFVTAEYHLTHGYSKEDAITTMVASAVGDVSKKMGKQKNIENRDLDIPAPNSSGVSTDRSVHSISPDIFEDDDSLLDIDSQDIEIDLPDISLVGILNKKGSPFKNKHSKKNPQNVHIPDVIDIPSDGSRSSTPSRDVILVEDDLVSDKIESENVFEAERDDLNDSEKVALRNVLTNNMKENCISNVDTRDIDIMVNRFQKSIEKAQVKKKKKSDKENFRDLNYIDENRNKKNIIPNIEEQFLLEKSDDDLFENMTEVLDSEMKNGEFNDEIVETAAATVEEELRKDTDFICQLFPHLNPADIETSLVDNFYHPERKAHVLEAYIEKCIDSNEMVPDDAFSELYRLKAAKKRPLSDTHGTNVKKAKYKHELPTVTFNVKDDNYPNTSSFQPVHEKIKLENVVNNDIDNKTSEEVQENTTNEDDSATNSATSPNEKRIQWIEEKTSFLSIVLTNIDRNTVYQHVSTCDTEDDVQLLLLRLMEQDAPNGSPLAPPPGPPVLHPIPQRPAAPLQPAAPAATSAVVPPPPPPVELDEPLPGPSEEGRATEMDTEERIQVQVKQLQEMFHDADPDYLHQRCSAIIGQNNMFDGLVTELLEKPDYPKMEEYLKRQKRMEMRKKFIEGMSVEEFLEYFEDPDKVFSDTSTSKANDFLYIENAKLQLLKDLPQISSKDIDNELRKNNYHYFPALRAIQDNTKLNKLKSKRKTMKQHRDFDDFFLKELCYVKMETDIKHYLLNKEEEKRLSFLRAKDEGLLKECGCCYDDEVLEDDMSSCEAENKHKFCNNCVRRFTEEEIGQGRVQFRCLDGDCKAEFSLSLLKRLMKPSVFSNMLQRRQMEEITAAGLDDLESCPFCNFATIMPDKDDKVFKCLNPECMKDSCRYCKEPNHVPLRCEEVEKAAEKDARTFMENSMTEAMVRICWKCSKRFIKEDGCNKMRCSCGAMMCYICKKPIQGYEHFEDKPNPTNPDKCPLWSNSLEIHAKEVRQRAEELKKNADPSIELKHDPTKDLPKVPVVVKDGRPPGAAGAPRQHPGYLQENPFWLPMFYVNMPGGAAFPPPAHRHQPPPMHRQQFLEAAHQLRNVDDRLRGVQRAFDNIQQGIYGQGQVPRREQQHQPQPQQQPHPHHPHAHRRRQVGQPVMVIQQQGPQQQQQRVQEIRPPQQPQAIQAQQLMQALPPQFLQHR